jgi:hypothetical protein
MRFQRIFVGCAGFVFLFVTGGRWLN